jgi:hypothetical protein
VTIAACGPLLVARELSASLDLVAVASQDLGGAFEVVLWAQIGAQYVHVLVA